MINEQLGRGVDNHIACLSRAKHIGMNELHASSAGSMIVNSVFSKDDIDACETGR